jgi:hypothetical protein
VECRSTCEERIVPQTTPSATLNLGFLTILHEANGYMGGYLVTNQWGRPLEFRLSTAVQPNRIHQVLYGETLEPYICADLVGKTLFEKTSIQAQFLITDHPSALDLRLRLEQPVAWLAAPDDPSARDIAGGDACVRPPSAKLGAIICHARFASDVPVVRELLERLDGHLDLAEPFLRIRDAMSEARKMGVTTRG